MQFFKYLSVYFYDFFNAKAEKAKANSKKSLNSYGKMLNFYILKHIAPFTVPGTPCPVRLHGIFPNSKTSSATEGASYLDRVSGEFSQKTHAEKCHGGNFPAHSGVPLPLHCSTPFLTRKNRLSSAFLVQRFA